MKKKPLCGNKDCCASTGICESITFGWGMLDEFGYWEFPCAVCARDFEKKHPQYGTCWPFPNKGVNNESGRHRL